MITNDLSLVHVSKQSILTKHFGIDMAAFEKLSEKEKEEANKVIPTSEEEKFMEIFKSDMPQLARLQRKMSVCLDVEVLKYDFDFVEFNFSGNIFRVESGKNAYRICKALEKDYLEGLQELCKQGCILKDGSPITDIKENTSLQIDEIQILKLVSTKFFFSDVFSLTINKRVISYGFEILELVVNKILSFTEIQNISIYEARKIYFLWRERQ